MIKLKIKSNISCWFKLWLVAKCSSEAGADLIVVYSTGKSRLMGLPTSRIGDSNKETIKLCSEIQNVTKKLL